MATGPFIQQIAVVKSASVVLGATTLQARIDYPITAFLNLNVFTGSFSGDSDHPWMTDRLKGSIYQGFFGGADNLTDSRIRSTFQSQPDCSTGNCTFQIFDSLAICSSCANITDLLKLKTKAFHTPDLWYLYNWTLPNKFVVSDWTGSPEVVSTAGSYDLLDLQAGFPIVNVTAIQPCIKENWDICPATAQECMLHWCVNTYAPEVVNGIFHETVKASVKYGYTVDPDSSQNATYVFHNNFANPQNNSARKDTHDSFAVGKQGSLQLGSLVQIY